MVTRIRTLNFLPDVFQTPTNAQFLRASLDQIVDQPNTRKIEGYIGSKFGYGINAKDYYVTEPSKTRTDYQLDPGVIFTNPNESTAKDFISYPGILDALKNEGALTNDNNRLFNSQFYSWDSFTDLDKIINFNQYYWLPEGPDRVVVATETVFSSNDYSVTDVVNGYNVVPFNSTGGSTNPTLTFLRGGTYSFAINQNSQFWIQGEPGVTGYSQAQPNLQTRDILGVINNGTSSGIVTFTVPSKNAQDYYNFPGNNIVSVVSTLPFSQVNGALVSAIGGIDGVTSLEGLTVMFYNTGVPQELGYVSNFFGVTNYDVNDPLVVTDKTINVTATSSGSNRITCNDTSELVAGNTITFSGTPFGGLNAYSAGSPQIFTAGAFEIGQQYAITSIGSTDWISIGVAASASVEAEINGTTLTVTSTNFGALSIGQTLTGSGVMAGTTIIGYDLEASLSTGVQTYIVNQSQSVAITTVSGYEIIPGTIFTASGLGSGSGTATIRNLSLYYVREVVNATQFTVSYDLNGEEVELSAGAGTLVGNINQGLYEGGYYSAVNENFYTISYVGDPTAPIIKLTPSALIPTEQKITAGYGSQWVSRNFYRDVLGNISIIPFVSAPLDTLYYQDGTSANKIGIIKIIDSNVLNSIDVETDIIGKPTYTSSNGIVFTNGLKVTFQGEIIPEKYKSGEYYVEGVGTAIQLIPVSDLVVPEVFTESTYIPWDTVSWDIGNWEGNSYIPVLQDYLTIARNSIDENAWSRGNRWFHLDVINATAQYNNDPDFITIAATDKNRAKRPIVEFYPNLKLFNSGVEGKDPVDFVDFRTTDAFSTVAGQRNHYPDVAVHTTASATVLRTDYASTRTVTASSSTTNIFVCDDTTGFNLNDVVTFSGILFGGVESNDTYYIKEVISATEFTIATIQNGVTVALDTGSGSMTLNWTPHSTTITIPANAITGAFEVDQYITDSTGLLPRNSLITSVSGTSTITIGISWQVSTGSQFPTTASIALIAADTPVDNYSLFDGSRIIFAADNDINVRNKIYVSRFSTVTNSSLPVITLTEVEDGNVLADQQSVALRGYVNKGKDFYFDGSNWIEGQSKLTVNQAPLFDIFDKNGISLSDTSVYAGSSFKGTTLFSYGIGTGADDIILGFPIKYSSSDNVGDISFDVSLNSDTFQYVSGTTPITQKINTGYVYNFKSRTEHSRAIGWQTAAAPSIQYQVFEIDYDVLKPTNTFECDIAVADSSSTMWPVIQVYVNNKIQHKDDYTVASTSDSTTVTFTNIELLTDTVVQILIYSNQVSKTAHYEIPVNLNNNPLNTDLTVTNIGDIRGQYQSIFYNNPNTTGDVFGANNYRDLGNVVKWGNRIIQNSASLVLPGAFMRTENHSLFNALMFNSREYIKFKTLLVDTINNSDYVQRYDPAVLLDDALDQITSSKTDTLPFFWSDMLPSKAAYISNTYSFANSLDISIYPLSKVYDFGQANYNGILVYLTRVVSGTTTTRQLIKGQDYTVSDSAPSLTVTLALTPGDKITVKEYNQTYGSYVPNTPTKMGLYPAFVPGVVLGSEYSTPTYFIRGHDGSYNKLYGSYDPVTNILVDFRDQVLLEYETRVYNNLKLSAVIPITEYEVAPGFFRDSDYSFNEWLEIYSSAFLNWVGQNRIDYTRQVYNSNDAFTYNYWQSADKVNKEPIDIGHWRGLFQYFYDTSTPNLTPWEMIGYKSQPTWWTERYGPAPYTSDNLVLWNDLTAGIDWNNGDPIVNQNAVREGLLQVLPVDSAGQLRSPLDAIVGNYNSNIFQRDWKVGDGAPAEFSYRRSSTYPFDLMRLMALTKPAKFFNLGVDVDHYKYDSEFDQYLIDGRKHLQLSDIDVYGSGSPSTSYINWIVDYEKQSGISATESITSLLNNLDVRLVYRLAGFSDKNLLKFYVEKGTPNSKKSSLLIPDESYSVLLYDNQPFNKIVYSGVVVQIVSGGFAIYGNSQTAAYFKIAKPKNDGKLSTITVEKLSAKVPSNFTDSISIIPYGTIYYSAQEVANFLTSYGAYLEQQGMVFDQLENELEVNWEQMVAEFLYWAQTGWGEGSITTLNPAAKVLKIDKDSNIVQPLTMRQTNFVLNQNLYPIQSKDLGIVRDGTLFSATAQNDGDTMSYGQFNVSNFEHGIVFDNVTLFNDVLYNLTTGLRQTRIALRGTKSADWNGTVDAQGFVYNQDNITEWDGNRKYTKGEIVKYKNKFWVAVKIVQPSLTFEELNWIRTDYDEVQKGLLPNSSTRSYESTLYYDINKTNLENDADLLSFSLIGYRPRDYLAVADLTDITQVNVYKNLIKSKGTTNSVNAFKGAQLPQGEIDYDVYENWAIKSGDFGGVLNSNFIEFKVNQNYMTGNPSIVGLTNGVYDEGVQQEVPIYNLYNYGRPVTDINVLPTISSSEPIKLFPDAGYVNFNDVKMSSYFYSQLPNATNSAGVRVPISDFYVRDYVWIANLFEQWQVLTPYSIGQVVSVKNNKNNTVTLKFNKPHTIAQYESFAIVNFNSEIDGYYIANIVVNPFEIIVGVTLKDPSVDSITGKGVGLKFTSQRVDQPADISNLPLLDAEFIKNTVWVDNNNDGGWAVYRKSINYKQGKTFTKSSSSSFGSAVATNEKLGYLITDAVKGEAHRYELNTFTKEYELVQTITQEESFGTAMVYAGDLYAISAPNATTPAVFIYQLQQTTLINELVEYQEINPGHVSVNWGQSLAMSGDQNWLYVSDYNNTASPNIVYVYRKSQTSGQFELATTIEAVGLTSSDKFGYSISTDYYGSTVVISNPNENYVDSNVNFDEFGKAYVYQRSVQNLEVQYSTAGETQTFPLAWTPSTTTGTVVSTNTVGTNEIALQTAIPTLASFVNYPVVFSGTVYDSSNIMPDKVYFIKSVTSTASFTLSEEINGPELVLGTSSGVTMVMNLQSIAIFVSVNGKLVGNNNYGIVNNQFLYSSPLNAGDIINVSGRVFTQVQTLTSQRTPRIGVNFGLSTSLTRNATEILVGAPFELDSQNHEGAVYRFTNGGSKYGVIQSELSVNVTTTRNILLNGYVVTIPPGDATTAASAINNAKVTNVAASAVANKLTIQLVDANLAPVNEKLVISAPTVDALNELGIKVFTNTQIIECPHSSGKTQFGTAIKFNEFDSFIVSAPVGTRYEATTFDFIDDENQADDTLFDNNGTTWIDSFANAGAVYMFDYVSNYNESLANPGKFVYAQNTNYLDEEYGENPRFGTALDFNDYSVLIGTPGFKPSFDNGMVLAFTNTTRVKDWSVHRSSSEIVDINRITNVQLFSAETNNTLINLDYIDPLQGKILGAARENIDVVSNTDPAVYNTSSTIPHGLVWGDRQLGQIWFNTTNTRFINYHQNDITYNSKYWGTVFPGSDIAIYSWIMSPDLPSNYRGPGTPLAFNKYSVQYVINPSGALTPQYYYWVRDTNIVFGNNGKTLADSVIASYIQNPKNSGISYFSPLKPSVFALYNADDYFNANDSVLHIGFSTGGNDDVTHSQYDLIRDGYSSDFLPGVPTNISGTPDSLYDRLLDSLCGVDESGAVVPNPYLPKSVQFGIQARPRQSFFINRFNALKNYLGYANSILSKYPISETKQSSFLTSSGVFYNTSDYWEYINWWEAGYTDNTKSALQVEIYSDLATLSVSPGTIVKVNTNGDGKSETYVYGMSGDWKRIGLENGTIKFKSSLWDYETARLGFGDNFFDTTPYDVYPSEETRNIIRALSEQIYTQDLLIYRNKSLILLFNYIQSETIESQNYVPWLNKTSFVDVSHTIRELQPIDVYQNDNQEFLAGYMNEAKPYHVVIKEFLFKYTGSDVYQGTLTDFDLPAKYNSSVERFVTPQLVYSGNTDIIDQYLPGDPIWEESSYSEWYQNHGVSIVGQNEVQLTSLSSYISLNSYEFAVDNAQGLPVNGIVYINEEQIGYANVDRALNILSGLTRGVNGTEITTHNPGSLIYMNLPPVLLLDGGRAYTEPPKVVAYIDTTKYPAPTRQAVLSAVMNLDSVLRIDVIDPGQGYEVLPQIKIDPALVIQFSGTSVNTVSDTIQLYAPVLQTGDLVQYNAGAGNTPIGGLDDGQWYYVNVLETVPTVVVGMYTRYSDAITDENRVILTGQGTGETQTLNLGAKASAISSASPIRENNITLRFDRTTYDSDIIEWVAGKYYGAYYAGTYSNSESVASSSIQLQSTQPPIDSILASAQGVAFEIAGVRNDRVVTYSSLVRHVEGTFSGSNTIKLIPLDDGTGNLNASGTTIGFYIGMPIKFKGAVVGGLVNEEMYYVHSIIDVVNFTITTVEGGDPLGSPLPLTAATVGAAGLDCYVGEVTDTAILTVNYPGIYSVTTTSSIVNSLTAPVTALGTGGTSGFYVGLPIFFTGNVFGGVRENQIYYVTTVIDKQTFTISETMTPSMHEMIATVSSTDTIVTSGDVSSLRINDPVIFTNMVVSEEPVTSLGGIQAGTLYYIAYVTNNSVKISESINGPVKALTDMTGTMILTSQENVVPLTNAVGNMVMNVSLPVSPGQVNGQRFTMYQTSPLFVDVSGTNSNLISRKIDAALGLSNRLAISRISGGTSNMYINMPFRLSANIGALSSGTTYYIIGIGDIEVEVTSSSSSTNTFTCDDTTSLYVNMPIIFSGLGLGGINIGVEYYIHSIVNATQFAVTNTPGGAITILTTTNGTMTGLGSTYVQLATSLGGSAVSTGNTQQTATISNGTPAIVTVAVSPAEGTVVQFSTTGTLPAGISSGTLYYVRYVSPTTFNLSLTGTGALINTSSTGTGVHTLLVVNDINLNQYPSTAPMFDASYILGGYRVNIADGSSGYAVDNIITILGTAMGGTHPANDLALKVTAIDSVGKILSTTCTGIVPSIPDKYFMKVVAPNEFAVFSNALMTVPVSGVGFPYTPIREATVLSTTTGTNLISLDEISEFSVGDRVIFTGNVASGLELGITYYILTKVGNDITVSLSPGGTVVALTSTPSTNFMMAKAGAYALLPEPFVFNQSKVKYNNRVYVCVISNNDPEFIFGKWELLNPSDRRLNALDRIAGYYQPTDNMPGPDLTQLVEGDTYPNSTYMGNPFAPEHQFEIDAILQDQPFYPNEVNISSVIWDGSQYLAASDVVSSTNLLRSSSAAEWSIEKLAESTLFTTDIIKANGSYIITTQNSAIPLIRSNDGVTWTANVTFSPNTSSLPLNAITHGNGMYVAVGDNIVTSPDSLSWSQRFTFTNPSLPGEFFGVKFVNALGFSGYVAVGKGNEFDYSGVLSQIVPVNLVAISTDANNWVTVPSVSSNGFNSVASDGVKIVTVGDAGVIYVSENGSDWLGVTETSITSINAVSDMINVGDTSGFQVNDVVRFNNSFNVVSSSSDYYVVSISSLSQLQVSTSLGGPALILTDDSVVPSRTYMSLYPAGSNLTDIEYANGMYITVGDNGTIKTSIDGYAWTSQVSNTSENLNSIKYNSTNGIWIAVGDNNTVVTSNDNGITWIGSSLLIQDPTIYNVQGNEFTFGYGPEELVPGIVTDNMTMIVHTRPGTNWEANEYAHVGYNVVSKEFTPTSGTQTVYSFLYMVETPAQLAVWVINGVTGLATRIYEPDYDIDWHSKHITLSAPLAYTPVIDKLRIEVYEIGNSNQLVKANNGTDPIRVNTVTGFNEIEVNCNYSASIFSGSGVIRPNTEPKDVIAIATESATNTIVCENVADFVLNDPITFQGTTFGGIQEDTTYYVKTISYVTNKITISTTYNSGSGTAGPTFAVTEDTGAMHVIIQVGTGQVWTTPITYYNGNKLVFGTTGTVTRLNSATNTITCNTTAGLIVNSPIVFSDTIFGGVINPHQTYYVSAIVDGNEFTISETVSGSVVALTSATGGATFVSNDYAFGIASNGVSAKIIFARGDYDQNSDYITYTLFGETAPEQYGYTIPETQMFTGSTGVTTFNLTNYIGAGSANPSCAIVEIDGLRATSTDYVINATTNQITFTTAPANGARIAVTTYNETQRQYMITHYGLTGNNVSAIANINNSITPPIATTNVSLVAGSTITAVSTTGFIAEQPIMFKGTSFGGLNTNGLVYYVVAGFTGTTFSVSLTPGGSAVSFAGGSGLVVAYVGGTPAVRVTTSSAHNLTENAVIRIDGTSGSVQLNNSTYYVKIISPTQFDLYAEPYNPAYSAINVPVTVISSYTGGGYVWIDGQYVLSTTSATETSTDPILGNRITVADTSELVMWTPVVFTKFGTAIGEPLLGGIVAGTKYFVREVFGVTEFSISETLYGDEMVLTNESGTMNVSQWEFENVDRLWVTINGYRVPSSSLKINTGNYISILSAIGTSDEVIITSMMPSATPNEMVYLLNVNQTNQPTVYRANSLTRTWLSSPLYNTVDSIQVDDVTRVTDETVQESITPVAVSGLHSIGIFGDKRIICNITVFNNTTGQAIARNNYKLVVQELSPVLQITQGAWITAGDSLTITVLQGNLVFIDGELIKFSSVDLETNTLSGLQRGTNGTGERVMIPLYSEVYGILSSNKMSEADYFETWNSNDYDAVDGDPLQVSNAAPAIFLQGSVN